MWVKLILLFYVFSFLFRTDHSFDQDLGRHIRLGEIIWQTKQVPLINLFSYTYPNFPFINSHWLFEVLVYLGQQTIGLQAILVLKVAIVLSAVWLILQTVPKNQYLLLPIGFIFLHVLRERPELRPEILSFLFTSLSLFILEHSLKSKKTNSIFALPLIQLIWVNSHIYFIVGLILQAIYLTHLVYQYLRFRLESKKIRLLTIIFLISVIASLINPSGLKGFLNPLTFNQNYGYTIVENQTMFLLESISFKDPNFLFVKIASIIIFFSILIAFVKKRFSLKNFGLVGFGLTLALMNVRSFPYLVFISLPAVIENFGFTKKNAWTVLIILTTTPILLFESFLYLNGDYYKKTLSDVKPKLEYKESSKNALDFVFANNLLTPIFNNFDIGSYITYRGFPKYPVFVDGRPGEYPKEFFQEIYIPMQNDPQKFQEIDQKFGFKTIIFSHTDQTPWAKAFLPSIVKNNNWRVVYIDDFIVLLIKNTQPDLPAIDLSKLDPSFYSFDSYISYLRLANFLIMTGNLISANKFYEKAWQLAGFEISGQNNIFW